MFDKSSISYLQPYIDATNSASSRFRRVLIVVIIASVLAFAAFWNARQGSWYNSRLSSFQQIHAYLSHKDKKAELDKKSDTLSKLRRIENNLKTSNEKISQLPKRNVEDKKILELEKTNLEAKKQKILMAVNKESFDIAKEEDERWLETEKNNADKEKNQIQDEIDKTSPAILDMIKSYDWDKKEQVTPLIEYYRRIRLENILLIRIPFFGVVLDVNDLGMIGGFTFLVILMWFRFSLWREYYNLSQTFKEAREEHLEYCYKTLSMEQVLTVPPNLSERPSTEKPWGKIVRLLYFLPVLVQIIILSYDYYTFYIGWTISQFNTIVSTSVGLCFLALSGVLTYWCLQLTREIDNEWVKAAKHIEKLNSQTS